MLAFEDSPFLIANGIPSGVQWCLFRQWVMHSEVRLCDSPVSALVGVGSWCVTYKVLMMISVTCPEALMGLSAMVFYIMRSRDYPTSAWAGYIHTRTYIASRRRTKCASVLGRSS